jgi:hypothetical protein
MMSNQLAGRGDQAVQRRLDLASTAVPAAKKATNAGYPEVLARAGRPEARP